MPIKPGGCMNAMMYYLGSLALCGLSFILFKGTSPFAPIGSSIYEKRRTRRLVAKIILVIATFALGIGVLAQFSSSNP